MAVLLGCMGYALMQSLHVPAAPYRGEAALVSKHDLDAVYAALKETPERPDLWLRAAALETARGEHARAALSYRALLALRPDNPHARLRLAACLLEVGEAEATFEVVTLAQAVLDEPQASTHHPEARYILGAAAFRRGAYAEAAQLWRPLLSLPLSAAPWYRVFAEHWQSLPVVYR